MKTRLEAMKSLETLEMINAKKKEGFVFKEVIIKVDNQARKRMKMTKEVRSSSYRTTLRSELGRTPTY